MLFQIKIRLEPDTMTKSNSLLTFQFLKKYRVNYCDKISRTICSMNQQHTCHRKFSRIYYYVCYVKHIEISLAHCS